jgi:hypothetical protein
LSDDEIDGAIADVPGETGAVFDDDGNARFRKNAGFGIAFVESCGTLFDDGTVALDALRAWFRPVGLRLDQRIRGDKKRRERAIGS